MDIPRRRLLSLAPAAAALAACGLSSRRPTVDVRDYGALGDGSTDDSDAILAAAAALKPGHTLYFPEGSYRFTRRKPDARAAIVISGISDVAVEFADHAELLMDNLAGGLGTSHGILVRGPVTGITLRNVRVRWKTQPVERSFGDGVRIVGYPDDKATPPADWTGSRGPVTDVRILGCEVRSSPQAGVIMMGASGIRVDGLTVRDSMADGLHFNACRRATVHNHRAVNTGDDGLALVTYYANRFSYNNVAQTFSFPDLNDWSNSDFTITNVNVAGGGANGVRMAGANRVGITWLTVTGKRAGAGVIIDSAAEGVEAGWFYVGSRGIRLDRVRIEDCDFGIHLLARPNNAVDPRFTTFDVEAKRTTIRDCTVWGVRAESITAQRATGLRLADCAVAAASPRGGNGGVGLTNVDGMNLGRLAVTHPDPVTVFSAENCTGLTAEHLGVTITGTAEGDTTAAPCVYLLNSDGRIAALDVQWPGAPESWQPVRMVSDGSACDRPAGRPGVEVSRLSVQPPVGQAVATC